MLLRQEIFQEINELIAVGKTEQALVKLRRSLETDAPTERKALQHTLLLSGQYHTWEEEKLSGVKDDSKELARINKELLRLVDNLANPNDQAYAYTPPTTTSPDPLRPVYVQMQTPQHPQPPAKQENKMMKYLTYFFVGMGIIFVIALIATWDEPVEPEGPATTETIITQPNTAVTQPVAPPPSEVEGLLAQAGNRTFEPRVSQLLTQQIRNKMLEMANSEAELTPEELTQIDLTHVRQQFGSTNWYQANMGYISFSADGLNATYLNGAGALQLVYNTVYGFYIGTYAESTTGDTGYMSFVPPGQDDVFTVYVESEGFGTEGAMEWERR